jgi:hypothetical protein
MSQRHGRHPGPEGYPLFWSELDTGGGLWENVPDVIRAGFRVLLDLTDSLRDANSTAVRAASHSTSAAEASIAEMRVEHARTAQSVEAAATAISDTSGQLRRVASDVASVGQRVQQLER